VLSFIVVLLVFFLFLDTRTLLFLVAVLADESATLGARHLAGDRKSVV